MLLDPLKDRLEHVAAGSDLVGQGGEADGHAFAGVALCLPVERLVSAELLEQDHGQEVGPGPSPGCDVEGRRGLGDALAIAAAEPLAHRLDHLPLAGDHLQRLGHVLAQLAEAGSSAACAGRRRGHDDALAGQVRREGLA